MRLDVLRERAGLRSAATDALLQEPDSKHEELFKYILTFNLILAQRCWTDENNQLLFSTSSSPSQERPSHFCSTRVLYILFVTWIKARLKCDTRL